MDDNEESPDVDPPLSTEGPSWPEELGFGYDLLSPEYLQVPSFLDHPLSGETVLS